MQNNSKTIFCDIDGTLIEHCNDTCLLTDPEFIPTILPGTLEKLKEWDLKGYYIILTTGRKESMRKATEAQLRKIGIFYDQLVMGFGGAKRYIINDRKKDSSEDTVFSININRNEGVKNVDI